MFLAGRNPDYVTKPNLLDRAIPALCPADAGDDDENLTERMCVRGVRAPASKVTPALCTNAGLGA